MDNRAYDSLPKTGDEFLNIGAEGELLDAVFCLRCGTMNDAEAMKCKECGDLLVEQGTGLRSRLGRIRRYARGNDLSGLTGQEFRASVRQLLTPTKQNTLVNPKHQELIGRIAQSARSIDQPQHNLQAPDFLTILLAPVVYALFPLGAEAQDTQPTPYKLSFGAKLSTRGMIILLLIILFVAIFAFIFLQRLMQVPLGIE